jgi:hypothetical protein
MWLMIALIVSWIVLALIRPWIHSFMCTNTAHKHHPDNIIKKEIHHGDIR